MKLSSSSKRSQQHSNRFFNLKRGTKSSYVTSFLAICCLVLLSKNIYDTEYHSSTVFTDYDFNKILVETDRVLHPPTWVAGMVLDTEEIHGHIWDYLITLNCEHNFGIHIVVKYNAEKGNARVADLKKKYLNSAEATTSTCASPFIIFEEERKEDERRTDDGEKPKMNRVDRISKLRDFQRATLHDIFEKGSNMSNGVVILADFDLVKLPPIRGVLKQVRDFRRLSYPHDAICALGTVMLKERVEMISEEKKRLEEEKTMSSLKVKSMGRLLGLMEDKLQIAHKPEKVTFDTLSYNSNVREMKSFRSKLAPHYYDIFATVFKPDTFAYPYAGRLIQKPYKGENPELVRSDDEHGE